MALSFPLTAAQFWEKLPIGELVLEPGEALAQSRTAGGEITEAEIGARLWQGQVRLGRCLWEEVEEVVALLDVMRSGGGSFLAWDRRFPYPKADPTGSILGAATPTIASIAANRVDLGLAGLPAGYVLSPRDRIGFSYLTSPVRRALHKVAVGATASGGGAATVQVVPAIREGAAAGAAITLIRPVLRAKYIPGSFDPGVTRAGKREEAGFAFVQTLGGP